MVGPTNTSPDPELKFELKPDEILTAEFNYIAQSAFQANEDRARVASFFVVSVSSLAAAILGAEFLGEQYDPQTVNFGFSGAFFLLTIFGFLTTMQLARLRAAWFECARAMYQIKTYSITKAGTLNLGDAFRWKDPDAVPRFKLTSVSFLLTLEVALLSAVTSSASVYFLHSGLGWADNWHWPNSIGAGFLAGLLQVGLYWLMLYEPPARKK